MNLDMTQFGATQNEKQAQARTLLWGKYITFQPCLVSARVRSSEQKAMDRSFYYNENDRDISRFFWIKNYGLWILHVCWDPFDEYIKSDNCIQG